MSDWHELRASGAEQFVDQQTAAKPDDEARAVLAANSDRVLDMLVSN